MDSKEIDFSIDLKNLILKSFKIKNLKKISSIDEIKNLINNKESNFLSSDSSLENITENKTEEDLQNLTKIKENSKAFTPSPMKSLGYSKIEEFSNFKLINEFEKKESLNELNFLLNSKETRKTLDFKNITGPHNSKVFNDSPRKRENIIELKKLPKIGRTSSIFNITTIKEENFKETFQDQKNNIICKIF